MGICASCLGRDRSDDDDEESRLLFEDPNNLNYGAFNDAEPGTPQTDAQDTQRENEALQKIVAQTSNHLVDIWALQSQPASSQSPAADYSQYQTVLSKLSTENLVDGGDGADDAWGTEDDEEDYKIHNPKTRKSVGPLVATFKDIENETK